METNRDVEKLVEGYTILKEMYAADKEKARKRIFASTIRKGSTLRHRVLRIAAIVALPLLSSLLTYRYISKNHLSENYGAEVTIIAPQEGIMKYMLPDSSDVWLSQGSAITYHADFTQNNIRNVVLNGEGYFHVKSRNNSPFIVSVGDVMVRVTGTEFNCCQRTDETEVTLVEGSVDILDQKGAVLFQLKPEEQYRRKNNKNQLLKNVDSRHYTAWKDGELYFNNAPLPLVVERIMRAYNVTIVVKDSTLYNKRVTADFKNESIADIMDILSTLTNTKYEIDIVEAQRVITMD